MSSSSKTMFASALVAFAFSIGATIGISPSTAWAQTATNLKCKGCVNGKTIKKGAVKFNRLQGAVQNRITSLESATTALQSTTTDLQSTTTDLQSTTTDLQSTMTDLQSTTSALEAIAMERIPFYVTLDGDGAEQIVATNGPITYFVRCTVGALDGDVELIATSSQAGWFGEGDTDVSNGLAGDEMVAGAFNNPAAIADFENDIDDSFAVAPDGSYMAVDGEMLALGLNVFGHDCIAIGNVFVISGTP